MYMQVSCHHRVPQRVQVCNQPNPVADLVLSIVVAIGVKEDSQSSEEVFATKHGADLSLVFGVPEGKPIPKQVLPLTVDMELNHNLPVVHSDRLQVHRRQYVASEPTVSQQYSTTN